MHEKKPKFWLFFEQSGTFKKEFKKLGYKAYDLDIKNDFNETDYLIDLYAEIHKAYIKKPSIFNKISEDDYIIAFFPCIRFETQITMRFKGEQWQQKKWTLREKLSEDLKLHRELSENYETITKLVLVCLRLGIKLIIENPYSSDHYLTRYWCLKPALIDKDRSLSGDYFQKPTQYFFVNCSPKQNFIFEALSYRKTARVENKNKVERSLISPEYANRFIRENILEKEN